MSRRFAIGVVKIQQGSGSASGRRQRDNPPAVGAEVLEPGVGSRIEQRHDPVGGGVHRGEVRALAAIALDASEGEVCEFRGAAVLRGDVNRDGVVNAFDALLIQQAVLGISLPSPYTSLPHGDTNCNNTLEAADVLIALRAAVGLSTATSCAGTIR